MFQRCKSLTSLDLSSFKTNNVKSLVFTFTGCSSLQRLNLANFYTVSCLSFNNMFVSCPSDMTVILKKSNNQNLINFAPSTFNFEEP